MPFPLDCAMFVGQRGGDAIPVANGFALVGEGGGVSIRPVRVYSPQKLQLKYAPIEVRAATRVKHTCLCMPESGEWEVRDPMCHSLTPLPSRCRPVAALHYRRGQNVAS